jgi:DNA-binding Xre family transcriptional regulator
MAQASKDSMWVSYASELTDAMVKDAASVSSKPGTGLFIHSLDIKSIPALSSLFRRIAFNVDGGFVNQTNRTITFWRGNLESLTVAFSAFKKSGDETRPNFDDFSVIDRGQTVKPGSYEATVDAILYECDPEFRREVSKKRSQEERTFGAALRRLRKQRGLRREDFAADVAAKTVARIEQGQVKRVQKATLAALARHLAVDPEEIASW